MNVIWKITLDPRRDEIEVPLRAELLYAREQGDDVCIWFRCNPHESRREKRKVMIVGTGMSSDDIGGRHLGSAHLMGGNLILHVFERS